MPTSDGRLPSVNLSPEPFNSVWAQIVKCKSHIAAKRQVLMDTWLGSETMEYGSCHQTSASKSIQPGHYPTF